MTELPRIVYIFMTENMCSCHYGRIKTGFGKNNVIWVITLAFLKRVSKFVGLPNGLIIPKGFFDLIFNKVLNKFSTMVSSKNTGYVSLQEKFISKMFEQFKTFKPPANFIISNNMATAEFTRNPKAVIKSLHFDLGVDTASKDLYCSVVAPFVYYFLHRELVIFWDGGRRYILAREIVLLIKVMLMQEVGRLIVE